MMHRAQLGLCSVSSLQYLQYLYAAPFFLLIFRLKYTKHRVPSPAVQYGTVQYLQYSTVRATAQKSPRAPGACSLSSGAAVRYSFVCQVLRFLSSASSSGSSTSMGCRPLNSAIRRERRSISAASVRKRACSSIERACRAVGE